MAEPIVIPDVGQLLDKLNNANAEIAKNEKDQAEAALSSSVPFPADKAVPPIPLSSFGETEDHFDPNGNAIKIVSVNKIKVQDYVAPYLTALILKATNEGVGTIGATSSFRSKKKQQELYDAYTSYIADKAAYLAKNNNKVPNLAAKPGQSMHQFGLAVDFNIDGIGSADGKDFPQMKAFAEIAAQFGFIRTVWNAKKIEPWHFEFKGEAISSDLKVDQVTAAMLNDLRLILGKTQESLKRETLQKFYNSFAVAARTRNLINVKRKDHFSLHAAQIANGILADAKRTSDAQQSIQSITKDVPSQQNLSGVLFNFDTGLWNDGKSAGRIGASADSEES